MIVERYRDSDAAAWDAFVRASRNGTFLFERGYMDYHRDRFPDHSLVVRDAEGELIAVLPAHAAGDTVGSHDGLSYGGLVIGPRMMTPAILRAFEAVLLALRDAGFAFARLQDDPTHLPPPTGRGGPVRPVPPRRQLTRRDLLSVVDRGAPLPYQHRRARGIKKAQAAGVRVEVETDLAEFWGLLAATLAERFDATPVHTLAEIQALRDRFPHAIRLHAARRNGELLAGVVTYESERAAHAQYIAASPAGRAASALDLVFDELLGDPRGEQTYFDFGGSHQDGGRAINEGLIDQKEGFGARSVAHDQYRIDLTTVRPGILTGALK